MPVTSSPPPCSKPISARMPAGARTPAAPSAARVWGGLRAAPDDLASLLGGVLSAIVGAPARISFTIIARAVTGVAGMEALWETPARRAPAPSAPPAPAGGCGARLEPL